MAYVGNVEEVSIMPGRDGTGPMGFGAKTGRGFGRCRGAGLARYGAGAGLALGLGLGLGRRRGRRICFVSDAAGLKTKKELLTEEKKALKNRLDEIEKQLEEM